jgi:hypothetical protein
MVGIADDRNYALQIARRYFYDRNVEISTVIETFAESSDPLIIRVVDLMVHEPARTGKFITVSQRDYDRHYWPQVAAVLSELEKGDAGVLPPPPPITRRRLFWTTVLLAIVVLSAADNLNDFYSYMAGEKKEHVAFAAVDLGFGLLMSVLAVAGSIRFVQLVRVHRSQRER